MHHFCAAYVRDGSKAESPFLAVMSASTDCGHHVLALAWTQPAACKPDRSGLIPLTQSGRLRGADGPGDNFRIFAQQRKRICPGQVEGGGPFLIMTVILQPPLPVPLFACWP
jgi:hypothetical protein